MSSPSSSPLLPLVSLVALASLACGDDGGRGAEQADEADASATLDAGDQDAGDQDGESSDTAATSDEGETTQDSSTDTNEGSSTGTGSSETGEDTGVKFDLPPVPDAGGGGCGGGNGGDVEFSYIWISNSAEGTLTKLNTQTLEEEGRYITRPDHAGRPSRTSVNLSGDVAVANRDGGISKFLARTEDCPDTNGTPGVQTSTGKADVLDWNVEECRVWYTAFEGAGLANRPVAWTAGTFNQGSCQWEEQKLWTQTAILGQAGSMEIHRLDGETGEVEVSVPAPGVDLGSWGAYGGAVDGEDNFWFSTHGSGNPPTLSRLTYDTLELTTWPVPAGLSPYGMTVDSEGYAWVAGYAGGVARFTPESETWDVVASVTGLGMQADGEGRVWVGSYGGMGTGVVAIDVQTLEVLDFIPINAAVTKGVSIDFYGYVWVVDMANSAYRVDPDTHLYEAYTGLDGAYTYSDMTGAGLKNVAFPAG